MSEPTAKDVAFDLRTPCNDCPFRIDVPLHDGVCNSLPRLKKNIDKGLFAHTCHKSDSRSDGYEEGYKGKIQQCAGSRIMIALDDEAPEQVMDIYAHIYERDNKIEANLDMDAPVFPSFMDMCRKYEPMLREKAAKIEEDKLKIHIRRRKR